jgi:hypothetical protein
MKKKNLMPSTVVPSGADPESGVESRFNISVVEGHVMPPKIQSQSMVDRDSVTRLESTANEGLCIMEFHQYRGVSFTQKYLA